MYTFIYTYSNNNKCLILENKVPYTKKKKKKKS